MSELHESLEEFKKYSRIFPKAWKRFLNDIQEGKILVPANENWLRCHLFSECLSIMLEEGFPTPYNITVEDEKVMEGKRADLTLGFWEKGRFIVIEMKHFPKRDDLILEDIAKLYEFVKSHAIHGFFVMIGTKRLDLKVYGIEEEDKHSYFKWKTIKPPYSDIPLETLIVGLMAA